MSMAYYGFEILWFIMTFSIVSLGLNLVMGRTGLFNLAQVGFFALGGLGTTIVTVYLGRGFFTGLILGIVFCVVAALFVGIPTLRLRGDYFAIATLGFAEIIRVSMTNVKELGLIVDGVPPITILGHKFVGIYEVLFVFVFFAVSFLVMHLITVSPFGRVLLSIREDEVAAAALGKDVALFKLKAFVVGAVFAGVAGSLYVHHISVFSPSNYNLQLTFVILLMVILGGLGSNLGAVLGAVIITIVNEIPKFISFPSELDVGAVNLLIYSVLIVAIMIYRPSGILGTSEFTLSMLIKKGRREAR
jgi:branched-chain amino acid transport system permease protein